MRIDRFTLCIIAASAIVLVTSVYWAVGNWRAVLDKHDNFIWTETTCFIHNKTISTRDRLWRNEFNVSGFTLESQPEPTISTIAYRYGSSIFNQSRTSATRFANNFNISQRYPCWMRVEAISLPTTNEQKAISYFISMSTVSTSSSTVDLELAIISSFFALMMVVAFFLALSCAVRRQLSDEDVSIQTTLNMQEPHRAAHSTTMTKAEIDHLCLEASHAAIEHSKLNRSASSVVETCAICLDDEEPGAFAKLDCGHAFHLVCLRGWLLRGGVTCPLCCHKLNEKGAGDGSREHVSEGSSSGIRTERMQRIDVENREQQSEQVVLDARHDTSSSVLEGAEPSREDASDVDSRTVVSHAESALT